MQLGGSFTRYRDHKIYVVYSFAIRWHYQLSPWKFYVILIVPVPAHPLPFVLGQGGCMYPSQMYFRVLLFVYLLKGTREGISNLHNPHSRFLQNWIENNRKKSKVK
jgi:hypothetical protein